MTADETEIQSDDGRSPRAAKERGSRESDSSPAMHPGEISGYELRRFLGEGAYGRVWVALDQTTGRQVAIKFFSHRNALDWSLLSREVEKLVFLSTDRYVVQLLDIGWDAQPPYYVMEYVENGSLGDYLQDQRALPVHDAVEMFREVAIGLSHAHSKGVLHCDLKPANILLDQDRRPRLADFGQSRLSHEQSPALGTLFYMAPEQADLKAIPDVRWDVYALGALLYCMLTGSPPHRSEEAIERIQKQTKIAQRLEVYRTLIQDAGTPTDHRDVQGVDRALAEIIDDCISVDVEKRYPHVANVLEALADRDRIRARRPLLVLGILGPLLLLATMGLFGIRAYRRAVDEAEQLVRQATATNNRFAVEGESRVVANEFEKRFLAVERVADDHELVRLVSELLKNSQAEPLLDQLADPTLSEKKLGSLRSTFRTADFRKNLQDYVDLLMTDPRQPKVASWILLDSRGTYLAASFDAEPGESPVAKNFAHRTYFHGGPADLPGTARPEKAIQETHISTVFRSTSTDTNKVAITTPIFQGTEVLGIIGMTVELGEFLNFPTSASQSALLVDAREGQQGVVIEHPFFAELKRQKLPLPKLDDFRVPVDVNRFRKHANEGVVSRDPFGSHPSGQDYRGEWIANAAPVQFLRLQRDGQKIPFDSGLMMIVQQRAVEAVAPVKRLAGRMFREGLAALLVFLLVTAVSWTVVVKMLKTPMAKGHYTPLPPMDGSTVHTRETLELPFPERR